MGNDHRSDELPAAPEDTTSTGPAGPTMLALSTFRHSDNAIALAIERAAQSEKLIVVYVADVNLARYFIGTGVGLYPELQRSCEEELLREHERQGRRKVQTIAQRARASGLETTTYVRIGRFAHVCLEIIEKDRPSLVVTTRSRRPAWARRFFGSPVDYLIAHAGCPVVEA